MGRVTWVRSPRYLSQTDRVVTLRRGTPMRRRKDLSWPDLTWPAPTGTEKAPGRLRKGEAVPTRAPEPADESLDEQVVTLRETGKSYTSVAKALGIKRSGDAHAAFLRGCGAVRRRNAPP